MTTINAYLHFNGQCRDAMTFYAAVFGGELMLQPVEGTPMEQQCPAAIKHFMLHAMLKRDGLVLMASDMAAPEGHVKGNNVSLSVNCSSDDEIETFFSKLAVGGKVMEALNDQFWGAKWGAVTDQFGLNWMLNYDLGTQQQKG